MAQLLIEVCSYEYEEIEDNEQLIWSHEYFIDEILIFFAIPDSIKFGFDFDMLGFREGSLSEVEGDIFFIVEFSHQGRKGEGAEEVIRVVLIVFSSSNGIHFDRLDI